MITFNNRPNEEILLDGGEKIFHSRSIAVVALMIGVKDNEQYVLAVQRGPYGDEADVWCLPCGYLDWDEGLVDAVRREVYEETGIDLSALEECGDAHITLHPIHIDDDINANRQNITLRYLINMKVLPQPHNRFAESDEVTDCRWLPLKIEDVERYCWAFNHKEVLLKLTEDSDETNVE